MNKQNRVTILVLCLVPFIMVLGNSMLIPVLPAIKKSLHVSLSQVGLLITVFSIPAGIVIPFAGLLSDHVGRKKVMAPALLIYGIGGILAGLAGVLIKKPFTYILIARIIQGIGAGGTYQLAMALCGDEIQGKERTQGLGYLEAANGFGKVVSPLAGAALALISWQTPFFVYGILAFPIAAAVFWLAHEKPKTNQNSQSMGQYFKNFFQIWRQKWAALLLCFLGGMFVLFALFGVLSFFSDVLEKTYHVKTFGRGLILALPVLAMALASFTLGIILKKKPAKLIKPFIFAGLLIAAGGLLTFALLPVKKTGMLLPVLATILVGLGTGLCLPPVNTIITSAAPRKERGGLTCLYGTVRFFGVAMGPPVFALGMKHSVKIPLYAGVAIAIAIALLAILSLFAIKAQKILPQNMTGGGGGKQGQSAPSKGQPKGGKKSSGPAAKPQNNDDDWEPIEGL